jgi:hypothetical protein
MRILNEKRCNTFDSTLNKCLKYGKKNTHDGKIHYEFADSCRKDKEKCGEKGLNYEEEPNLAIKKITHNFIHYNYPYLLTIFSIFIIILSYKIK